MCSNICCVWFDQATKERQQIGDVAEPNDTDDTDVFNDVRSTPNDKVGRGRPTLHNQRADGLRNVRWAVEEEEMIQDLSHYQTAQENSIKVYAQQLREALKISTASPTDTDFVIPESLLSQSSIDRYGSVPSSSPGASRGNHSVQDYQMQLRLLELQNLKRLFMARQKADRIQDPSQRVRPDQNISGVSHC
jgi:hypothetical protein